MLEMSALGQKRTWRDDIGMSSLPQNRTLPIDSLIGKLNPIMFLIRQQTPSHLGKFRSGLTVRI
jgi:hypothetical protein